MIKLLSYQQNSQNKEYKLSHIKGQSRQSLQKGCLKQEFIQTSKVRSSAGVFLVELLVAVTILSIFMAAILDGLAQSYTQTTATQNQVIASNIAQELIDTARDAGWTTLSQAGVSDGQWHNVAVYGAPAGGQPAYLPRPLMVSGTGAEAQANQFRGTVRQMLTNLGNGQIDLVIEVTWAGENTSSTARILRASSRISQYGIHN